MSSGKVMREEDSEVTGIAWDVPWMLLVAPEDRLQRVMGFSLNPALTDAMADAELMSTREEAPGVYEQALGATEDEGGRKVAFFLGSTGELGWQLRQYSATGLRLAPVYSEAMRRGLFVFVRWRRVSSRAEAWAEQQRILRMYDYAGNAMSDTERRMPDVFCLLEDSKVSFCSRISRCISQT
mmetsp:Transcript_39656/g.112474  ORF Transcript_39656/g.112474 Transcript_39656/m.112474 type:complete len:182 (+) Transcript_39656:59-604(+)